MLDTGRWIIIDLSNIRHLESRIQYLESSGARPVKNP
jgi:hypothetical protein